MADDYAISAAEAMAMTAEERADLPEVRIIRDPENLPPAVLERAQAHMAEVVRQDGERDARRAS